ncbi:MAG: ROK family protein [Clostridia bacterium]|nr:ROK family protein [Clostridia bacterium]
MKSPDELRKFNTLKVLRFIADKKQGTKSEIARATNLTMVTVGNIINMMVEREVLMQDGIDSSNLGRNSVIYSFNLSKNHIIGINMGIDYISFREEDLEGNIIGRKYVQVEIDISYEEVLSMLVEYIKHKENILGVGITIPGVSNQETGKVEFLPNLKSIKGQYLRNDITAMTNLFTIVEKDVYAGAGLFRENGSKKSTALLSIKGGIGCGVICNGSVLKGHDSMAGEIGHISINPDGPLCSCGQKGCIEKYAADYALSEQLGMGLKDMVEAANMGDAECLDVLRKACDSLVILTGYINKFYNPEELFINSRWLEQVASIKQYFNELIKDQPNLITIIYDSHNYEKGAVNIIKEKLLSDIENNHLLGG